MGVDPWKAQAKARLCGSGVFGGGPLAGTPHLTSVKYLVSRVCTRSHAQPKQDKVLMLLDVKSAFLFGTCRRSVHIRLPPEDPHASRGDCSGRLLEATYGTKRGTSGLAKSLSTGHGNVWGCWSPKLCQGCTSTGFHRLRWQRTLTTSCGLLRERLERIQQRISKIIRFEMHTDRRESNTKYLG